MVTDTRHDEGPPAFCSRFAERRTPLAVASALAMPQAPAMASRPWSKENLPNVDFTVARAWPTLCEPAPASPE